MHTNSNDIAKALIALNKSKAPVVDSAANNLGALSIFSLDKVPWGVIIFFVIIILLLAITYQLMSKKGEK